MTRSILVLLSNSRSNSKSKVSSYHHHGRDAEAYPHRDPRLGGHTAAVILEHNPGVVIPDLVNSKAAVVAKVPWPQAWDHQVAVELPTSVGVADSIPSWKRKYFTQNAKENGKIAGR